MFQVTKINEVCFHIDYVDKIFDKVQEFRKHYDKCDKIFVHDDNSISKDVTFVEILNNKMHIATELVTLLSKTMFKFVIDSMAPEFLTLVWIKDGVQWEDFGLLADISSYIWPGGYIELVDNELADVSYIIYFKYYKMFICPGSFVYNRLKEVDATGILFNHGEVTREMIHLKRYRTLQ